MDNIKNINDIAIVGKEVLITGDNGNVYIIQEDRISIDKY